MAVEIELDLDASSALGEIGAVSLALENLDKKFDDLADLDLELGDIGAELRDLIDLIDEAEFNLDSLADDIKQAANALDNASVGIDTPDGETGAGDSSGNDPPSVTIDHRGILPDGATDGGHGDAGGMGPRAFAQKMDSLFGTRKGIFMGEGTVPRMHKQWDGSFADLNPAGKSMREVDSLKDPRRLGVDVGLGTESLSMARKRLQELSDDELADLRGSAPDIFGDSRDKDNLPEFDFANLLSTDNDEGGPLAGIRRRLRKLKPSMSRYLNLLAAVIPLMATFAVQAAGAAAALGGVAAAGAAVMGLGLLGHADSMAGSFQQAKLQVQELKGELFDTFQPAMQLFAPMQANFFDWMPGELEGVADQMEGLTQYEDTFYDIFSIGTDTLEQLLAILTQNEDAISAMAVSAMQFLGSGLIDLFSFLLQTAYENWQLMVQLGVAFKNLGIIAYNVVRAASAVVTAFLPLIKLVADLSGYLNSDLIIGLAAMVSGLLMVSKAMGILDAATLGLLTRLGILTNGSFIASIIGGLSALQTQVAALIAQYTALSGAAANAAAAIAMTGIGALAVGAGAIAAGSMITQSHDMNNRSGFGGAGGGGNQVVYNDNRQYTLEHSGEMDYGQEQRSFDQFQDWDSQASQMDPPSPGTNTESSTSGPDTGGDT